MGELQQNFNHACHLLLMWFEKGALDSWLILALIHLFCPQTTCCPCAARGQLFMIYALSFIKGILICSCGILIYHSVTLCPCSFTRMTEFFFFFLRMLLDFLYAEATHFSPPPHTHTPSPPPHPLIYFNHLADWKSQWQTSNRGHARSLMWKRSRYRHMGSG